MPRVSTHRRFWLAVLALHVAAVSACAEGKGGTATDPVAREDGPWADMHRSFLDRAKRGDVGLLFLGDSITQGWHENDTWKRHYSPRHAANFGIGGDRTQHVLWRLDHGELDGIKPKAVVIMIGTNNVGNNTPEEIFEGVKAIIERVRSKLPQSPILLLGIFPRGANRDKNQTAAEVDPRPLMVNEKLATLDDGKMIKYLDIGPAFLEDGKIPKEAMPDFLHLSPRGYRIWAEAMEPTLWDLMERK